jgi:hypothetical protein
VQQGLTAPSLEETNRLGKDELPNPFSVDESISNLEIDLSNLRRDLGNKDYLYDRL